MFTVKVDGRETAIEPVPLGNGSVLGIIVDTDSTIQNFDQKVGRFAVEHLHNDDLAQLRAGPNRIRGSDLSASRRRAHYWR